MRRRRGAMGISNWVGRAERGERGGQPPRSRLGLEALEDRWVPAIVLGPDGGLTVTGTTGNDFILVNQSNTGTIAQLNNETKSFGAGQVTAINLLGDFGDDTIRVDGAS